MISEVLSVPAAITGGESGGRGSARERPIEPGCCAWATKVVDAPDERTIVVRDLLERHPVRFTWSLPRLSRVGKLIAVGGEEGNARTSPRNSPADADRRATIRVQIVGRL